MRFAQTLSRSAARSLTLGAALIVLACAATTAARAADQPPERPVERPVERIVSIGGAVTEIVHALGALDQVVAVDTTSTWPEEAEALPDVGYMRRLSPEPVLALEPTLVLAVEDAGPPSALDQLKAAGARVVTIADDPSPEGVVAKVRAVAAALGRQAAGEALVARLDDEFAALREAVAALPDRPRVLFLLSVGRGAPLVAGRETSAAGIIALAGGRNAVEGFTDFKPLTPEAAITAAPDIILVPERSVPLLGGPEAILARPELAATPAGRAGRLLAMDAQLLLGFGPRTPDAIRRLAAALHPGISLPGADGS